MKPLNRLYLLTAASALLLTPAMLAGCGSDSSDTSNAVDGGTGGSGGTSNGGSAGQGGSSAGGGGGQAGASQDGGAGASQDASTDGSAMDGDVEASPGDGATGDAADASTKSAHLQLNLDHNWIWSTKVESYVKATCHYVDPDGKPLTDPGDLTITTSASNVTNPVCDGGGTDASCTDPTVTHFGYPDFGVYDITCTSASLGLSSKLSISVAFVGMSPRHVATMQANEDEAKILQRIMDANEKGDVKAYKAAVGELLGLRERFMDVTGRKLLQHHPKGWPTMAQIEAAGMKAQPGDATWAAALDVVNQKFQVLEGALDGLSAGITDSEAKAVIDADKDLRTALQAWTTQSLSDHGYWLYRDKLATYLGFANRVGAKRAAKLGAYLAANPPTTTKSGEMKPMFDMIGMIATTMVQSILSHVGIDRSLTAAAGVAMAQAVANAVISNIIKDAVSPGPNAPELISIHGGAAGYVYPGHSFSVYGNFKQGPAHNAMVFIHPEMGKNLAAKFLQLVSHSRNPPNGSLKDFVRSARSLRTIVTILQSSQPMTDGAFRSVLHPKSGDTMIQEYGPLPTGVNCSKLQLPMTGTMIPWDEDYGYGDAMSVNVIGEAASACQH